MQNMSGGKTALGLDTNVGALICYVGNLVCSLGLIYSIIVVVTDKTNKLTRFHAFQSILLSAAGLVIGIPVYIVMMVGFFIDAKIGLPVITGLSGLLLFALGIAILVFWVMAAIKAFNGQIFKIPVIGNFADKFSN
jgi:uncharacterized membrane protein